MAESHINREDPDIKNQIWYPEKVGYFVCSAHFVPGGG